MTSTIDSSGSFLHSTIGVHRAIEPNSYAEMLGCIRMVMRFAADPQTVMDSLFEAPRYVRVNVDGKRRGSA